MSDVAVGVVVDRMSPALKCARCYKHDYDKGAVKGWPEVCPTCAKALETMGFTIVELLLVLVIPAIVVLVCMWTDRNLDYLLTWIAGAPRNCPWWLSTIATFVGNGLALIFNVVMEIIRIAR